MATVTSLYIRLERLANERQCFSVVSLCEWLFAGENRLDLDLSRINRLGSLHREAGAKLAIDCSGFALRLSACPL